MVGRILSHYKVLEELSRGGMGIVYRAVDLKLDREVALKVLPPELVSDPERKRRFIQEAKAAAKLEHPHIGVVHEIDEAEGVTFIAYDDTLEHVLATLVVDNEYVHRTGSDRELTARVGYTLFGHEVITSAVVSENVHFCDIPDL